MMRAQTCHPLDPLSAAEISVAVATVRAAGATPEVDCSIDLFSVLSKLLNCGCGCGYATILNIANKIRPQLWCDFGDSENHNIVAEITDADRNLKPWS